MSAHQHADAGPTPYDRRTVTYERIPGGALVATASNAGRSAVAIVHPRRTDTDRVRRWELAGEITDQDNRPAGASESVATSCAEAAQALGVELGLEVVAFEVKTP